MELSEGGGYPASGCGNVINCGGCESMDAIGTALNMCVRVGLGGPVTSYLGGAESCIPVQFGG